jgi:hypothetical protein
MDRHIPLSERQALCSERVTLDGKPAVIGGYRSAFASVTQLRTGTSFEWAWPTVARIVANGGAFKS